MNAIFPFDEKLGEFDEVILRQGETISSKLNILRLGQYPPDARKTLRSFSLAEAAYFLGVTSSNLKKIHLEGRGPSPTTSATGRRSYTAEQLFELRRYLDQHGRTEAKKYVPRRRAGERMQVLSIVNFKGGSGKTTTTAHLAQYLAFRGYRVLAVDLDPQASLSTFFGHQPELDVGENETIYGAIRYDASRREMAEIVRATYIPNLHVVPGQLELMEFEHETPKELIGRRGESSLFFARVGEALAQVSYAYDVVVIDCPPQLGFLTLSALCAATAVLITVHPQMLDVMSMSQFLNMTGSLLDVVANAGGTTQYDWMRYLVTRYEPSDGPQTTMVGLMRSIFGSRVLTHPMVKSTAIADAGLTKQTLYEVERQQFTRGTYDRAVEALDLVNGEIEGLVRQVWGRS